MEEKLLKEKKEKELALEEARKNKPSAASIFGGAKPVDTSQGEKEIESKLEKMTVKKETDVSEDKEKDLAWRRKDDSDAPKSGAYRPPGRRDDPERRSDRGYDDSRERDRGYDDRRDRDRGYDDRRDTRGYDDRRDNRGSNDRRDDRYDRRDRRSEPDSRDDRDRRDDRVQDDKNSNEQEDGEANRKLETGKSRTPEPQMKKLEDPVIDTVAKNKFALLQEDDNGSDEEN